MSSVNRRVPRCGSRGFQRQTDRSVWYEEQKGSPPLIEKGKRLGNRKLFGGTTKAHQIRIPTPYGGRLALAASVSVPYRVVGSEGNSLLFVNMHLENASKPDVRRAQMAEAVAFISQAHKPAVFGGDLNTFNGDGRIQTTGRFVIGQVDTPGKVAGKAVGQGMRFLPFTIPYAGWAKTGFDAYTTVKAHEDPTSDFNREHQLFDDVERVLGVHPVNQRDKIGYKHTWSEPKPRGIMGSTLDWLWVYDPARGLRAGEAKTYERLIRAGVNKPENRFSDHFPVRVDVLLTDENPDQPAKP